MDIRKEENRKNILNKTALFIDNVISRINTVLILIILMSLVYLLLHTTLNVISIQGVTNSIENTIYSFKQVIDSLNNKINDFDSNAINRKINDFDMQAINKNIQNLNLN